MKPKVFRHPSELFRYYWHGRMVVLIEDGDELMHGYAALLIEDGREKTTLAAGRNQYDVMQRAAAWCERNQAPQTPVAAASAN